MKKLFLISILALFIAPADFAGAEPPGKGVTPYGDFCWQCSKYGRKDKVQSRLVSYSDSVSAIKTYFHKRGYSVGGVYGKGRFIRVDIMRGKKVVDRIIFDRRSGRIRSIY